MSIASGLLILALAQGASEVVRDLGSADFETRERAQAAIIEMGEGAEPLLLEAERSADPEVLGRAACAREALAEIIPYGAVLDRGRLTDVLTGLRAGGEPAGESFEDLLQQTRSSDAIPDRSPPPFAASPGDVPYLLAALDRKASGTDTAAPSPACYVQARVVEALGAVRLRERDIDRLVRLLKANWPEVSSQADRDEAEGVLRLLAEVAGFPARQLREALGEPALAALKRLASSPHAQVRRRVLAALPAWGEQAQRVVLVSLLDDPVEDLAAEALLWLSEVADGSVLDVLRARMWEGASRQVRLTSARGVARAGGLDGLRTLSEALDDAPSGEERYQLWRWIGEALGRPCPDLPDPRHLDPAEERLIADWRAGWPERLERLRWDREARVFVQR